MYGFHSRRLVSIVLSGLLGLGAAQALAQEMGPGMMHGDGPRGMGHAMSGSGDGPGMHGAGARWRATLTEEQKAKMDRMHLALSKDTSLLRAQVALAKAELQQLIVADKPDRGAVEKKISEITNLKGKLMSKRYAHIAEMRELLTPEQRVSFDMGLLGRSRHGKAMR